MTNQERRVRTLTSKNMFLSEIRAWSDFNWSDAPWFDQMLKDRQKVTRVWAAQHKVVLSRTPPEVIRRSLTYQQAVRQFYDSHDWTKTRIRHEPYGVKKSYSIDPYAMMRHYSDEYSKGPGKKTYMPPWRKKQKTKAQKTTVIDTQFNAAVGLTRI